MPSLVAITDNGSGLAGGEFRFSSAGCRQSSKIPALQLRALPRLNHASTRAVAPGTSRPGGPSRCACRLGKTASSCRYSASHAASLVISAPSRSFGESTAFAASSATPPKAAWVDLCKPRREVVAICIDRGEETRRARGARRFPVIAYAAFLRAQPQAPEARVCPKHSNALEVIIAHLEDAQMDDRTREMAKGCYGYGRWEAPYWFIGPEQGQGRWENDELKARCDAWLRLGGGKLSDLKEFCHLIHEKRWHRENPELQKTWKSLMLLLMVFSERPTDNGSLKTYQRERWGRLDGETCIIELSGLPANNFNVPRERGLFRQERIKVMCDKMCAYKPVLVVIYGVGTKTHWESAGGYSSDSLRRLQDTVLEFTLHPTSRPTPMDAYWVEQGKRLRHIVNRGPRAVFKRGPSARRADGPNAALPRPATLSISVKRGDWTDPKKNLKLLDELEKLGFTDDAYWRVNNFRENGIKDTIRRHRRYCEQTRSFRVDGNGARVQQRLTLVLERYRAIPNAQPQLFITLADEAYSQIPL
jgi:hypothetical protein